MKNRKIPTFSGYEMAEFSGNPRPEKQHVLRNFRRETWGREGRQSANHRGWNSTFMVQKCGVHQLRLVVYCIICRVFYIPGGVRFPGFLKHQQYCHDILWAVLPLSKQRPPGSSKSVGRIPKSTFTSQIASLLQGVEHSWDIVRMFFLKNMTHTPRKFNSSPLKNGGWKTTFLLGR